MSKIRVHELAKELDKTNKEVLDFLKEKNIEVKSHMSSLEDDHVKAVKEHFEKPKKKSNIIQVFRPQNASNGGTDEAKALSVPVRAARTRAVLRQNTRYTVTLRNLFKIHQQARGTALAAQRDK